MLDTVPTEILTHIAYHLALPDLLPPLALLQSCKSIHAAIAPEHNPRLYARLFRTRFDVAAAERRVGELNAAEVTKELKRRMRALWRVGRMVKKGAVKDVLVQDLWVIYIMLIENDGKNIAHFIQRDGILYLPSFLHLYHEQHLLTAALEPGYPAETNSRSLVMWIAWLLSGYEGGKYESSEDRDERLFVLRPYVFAPQQYEVCFAPWTISDLPISDPTPQLDSTNPFVADLNPKSRLVTVEHFGREIEISPPILSHAAILRFFSKQPGAGSRNDDTTGDQPAAPFSALNGGQPILQAQLPPFQQRQQVAADIIPQANGHVNSNLGKDDDSDNDDDDDDDDDDDGDETFGAIRDLISNSRNHDRDFARLRSCYNPFKCRGMKRSAWKGSFDGCWEGTFSFFDFDAFREMLAGQSRALYEGPFGEQAQVWRIKETWVWRKDWAAKKREQRKRIAEQREKEEIARAKNKGKGKEVEIDGEVEGEGTKRARGLPLKGPVTNAGFPTDQPPSTSAGLATAAAEAMTLRDTIQQQVDAIEGYEVVPDEELDDALEEEDGGEEAGLEVILTGVGHSAWGRFILKGKIRAWDGMASLVKEYAPDSRGKWIYRGYVLSGDLFVGRWRDTFTPEAYVGYEGTFILNRR